MTASTQPKNRTLGSSDLSVLPIGLGCMSLSGAYGKSNDDEAIGVIHHAIDRGVNFLDSSDMYGWGHNETLIGKALAGGRRAKVVLATKFGQTQQPGGANGVDGSPAYVKAACDASLKRLGRRRDRPLLPAPRRSHGADRGHGRRHGRAGEGAARCARSGSARPSPRPSARAHKVHPLAAVQSEYSLLYRERCRGDAQDHARARHLLRRLLAARPQPADRRGAAGVRHSRGRRPRPPSALRRRQPRDEPRLGRRHRGGGAREGLQAGAGGARLAAGAGP